MTLSGARPHGYTEVQYSFIAGTLQDYVVEIELNELIEKTIREQPELEHVSSRMEIVFDGAHREHRNYYLGFAPKHQPGPPSDPHNLNEAPRPQIGSMPVEDAGLPLGWKEATFGRGT